MQSWFDARIPRAGGGRRVLVVLTLVALVFSLFTAAGSSAAVKKPPRKVTLEQQEGLRDQVVRVSWEGFRPTRRRPFGLYRPVVVQCTLLPTDLRRDCWIADAVPASAGGNIVTQAWTQQDGTGSAQIELRTSALLPQLGCSSSNPCSVVVYENDGNGVPAGAMPKDYAYAPITFEKLAADCPQVTDFDLQVETEVSSAPALYQWAADQCGGSDGYVLDVTQTASPAARENLLGGLVDVAVTSTPATEEELAAAGVGPETIRYAPLNLSAVVVAFNIVDPVTQQPMSDLVLSPRLVARIVSGENPGKLFQDPELLALNPGRSWPAVGTTPLLRAERNADALFLTDWLDRDPAARAYLDGNDAYGIPPGPGFAGVDYPTDIFENRGGFASYLPRQPEEVGRRLFYGASPTAGTATLPGSEGYIGVLDLPMAKRFGLPVARIINASGVAVAPDDASVAAGFRSMKLLPNGVRTPDVRPADPAAYPLVKVDYAMVRTTASTERKVRMRQLLEYAHGPGQATIPPGYFPLPDELRTDTAAVVSALNVVAPPPTSTSSTTRPAVPPPGGSDDTSTTTTTFAFDTVPFDPNSLGGGFDDFSGGFDDGSGFATDSTDGGVTTTTVPTQALGDEDDDSGGRAAKPVYNVARSGERLILPIVLVLALAAFVWSGVDGARRWRPAFAVAAWQRVRRTGRGMPSTGSGTVTDGDASGEGASE